MNSNIFFGLSCAFDSSNFFRKDWVSEGEGRTLQYVDGFNSFFQFYNKFFNSYEGVNVLDNTLENKKQIDKRILYEIPEGTNIVCTNKNNYGKLNKGAGILETLHEIKSLFSKYEIYFHYEPRLLTKSFKIFETFLESNTNVFIKGGITTQFQTGAFIVKTKDLIDYLNYKTPEQLCFPPISLEDDLFHFFKNIKKNNFTLVSNPGILWHDATDKCWREV